MENCELTVEEQKFVDVTVDTATLVEVVEGPKGAAQFVLDTLRRSEEITTGAADDAFLFENGIDSSSL